MIGMTNEQATAIYGILMKICGAPADQQDAFVKEMTGPEVPQYWTFDGLLGADGRFYAFEMRVDCLVEDLSEERLEIISMANRSLRWQAPLVIPNFKASRPKEVCVKYLAGVNKNVDDAIMKAGIGIPSGASWWYVFDALSAKRLLYAAELAQQHATPGVELVTRLQEELVAARESKSNQMPLL